MVVAVSVDEYARSVGARLRGLRLRAGWTLRDVEERSAGRWKAVVVGAYERGNRAMTVSRLAGLAAFYGVGVADLLPADTPGAAGGVLPRLTVDVRRVRGDTEGGPLGGFVAVVHAERDGRGRKAVTVWPEGLRILAAISSTPAEVLARILARGVIPTG